MPGSASPYNLGSKSLYRNYLTNDDFKYLFRVDLSTDVYSECLQALAHSFTIRRNSFYDNTDGFSSSVSGYVGFVEMRAALT